MESAVIKPLRAVPLQRLVRCLWHLGWELGWKYWRLQNACIVDPSLALRIAEDAERLAEGSRAQAARATTVEWWATCTRDAEHYESWAALVRKCHAEYSANTTAQAVPCDIQPNNPDK